MLEDSNKCQRQTKDKQGCKIQKLVKMQHDKDYFLHKLIDMRINKLLRNLVQFAENNLKMKKLFQRNSFK